MTVGIVYQHFHMLGLKSEMKLGSLQSANRRGSPKLRNATRHKIGNMESSTKKRGKRSREKRDKHRARGLDLGYVEAAANMEQKAQLEAAQREAAAARAAAQRSEQQRK